MAFENSFEFIQSFIAEEDMSAYQYCFVALSTTEGYVRLLNSGTDPAYGILQNAPAIGEAASVQKGGGQSKVAAGATLATIGAYIAPEYVDAADNGKAVASTYDAQTVAGILLQAGVEDELLTITLLNNR